MKKTNFPSSKFNDWEDPFYLISAHVSFCLRKIIDIINRFYCARSISHKPLHHRIKTTQSSILFDIRNSNFAKIFHYDFFAPANFRVVFEKFRKNLVPSMQSFEVIWRYGFFHANKASDAIGLCEYTLRTLTRFSSGLDESRVSGSIRRVVTFACVPRLFVDTPAVTLSIEGHLFSHLYDR